MEAATLNRSHDDLAISADAVRIGADIVELLTSGMYLSPVTVFREYVQNSADAIDGAREAGLIGAGDSGTVDISFDHAARTVTVRDNGSGIPSSEVASTLLAIGGSGKRGTSARGFRGVGRLSGLAYCRELEFRTKAAGEVVETVMTWDSIALRAGIAAARTETDLREVVAKAVRVRVESVADHAAHYFEVTLRGPVRHRQDILVNERVIAHYLSQVAPVAFDPGFSKASEIEERLSRYGRRSPPIVLTVAGERVYRPYRTAIELPQTEKMISVRDIEFFELLNVDGEVGAIGWLGHHEYVRSIPTGLGIRGLRARVGDIQVGEGNLFDELFKEPRFNGWAIGEINILDPRIVPNGRRDNFEVSHHSNNLLVQLGPIVARVASRCRTSSVDRNSTVIIQNTIAEVDRLLISERIEPIQISRAVAAVRRCLLKIKSVTDDEARATLAAELARLDAALAERQPAINAGIIASDEAIALVNKIVTNRDQAQKLIAELQRLRG